MLGVYRPLLSLKVTDEYCACGVSHARFIHKMPFACHSHVVNCGKFHLSRHMRRERILDLGVLNWGCWFCCWNGLAAFTAIGPEGSVMHFSSFAERHSLGGT